MLAGSALAASAVWAVNGERAAPCVADAASTLQFMKVYKSF